MQILIKRNGENIETISDFSDVTEKGEIAHFICELELLKQELLALWDEFKDRD